MNQCVLCKCAFIKTCNEYGMMKRVTDNPKGLRTIIDDESDIVKATKAGNAEASRVAKRRIQQAMPITPSKKQKKKNKKKKPVVPARPVHKPDRRGKDKVGGRE